MKVMLDGFVEPYDYMIKVCTIGSYKCGKTSFLNRFFDDYFIESHISTIGIHFFPPILHNSKGVDFKMRRYKAHGKKMNA